MDLHSEHLREEPRKEEGRMDGGWEGRRGRVGGGRVGEGGREGGRERNAHLPSTAAPFLFPGVGLSCGST